MRGEEAGIPPFITQEPQARPLCDGYHYNVFAYAPVKESRPHLGALCLEAHHMLS
jgi:hypothetical protein